MSCDQSGELRLHDRVTYSGPDLTMKGKHGTILGFACDGRANVAFDDARNQPVLKSPKVLTRVSVVKRPCARCMKIRARVLRFIGLGE